MSPLGAPMGGHLNDEALSADVGKAGPGPRSTTSIATGTQSSDISATRLAACSRRGHNGESAQREHLRRLSVSGDVARAVAATGCT